MKEFETPILVLLGGAIIGGLAWIAKILGERVIKKFFDQAEELEEKKESMLNEKINRVTADMNVLSASLKAHSEESTRTKIMMQSLNHQIDSFRADLKASDRFNQKSFLDLGKILSYVNEKLKSQGEQLTTLGKVIFKDWPEGK